MLTGELRAECTSSVGVSQRETGVAKAHIRDLQTVNLVIRRLEQCIDEGGRQFGIVRGKGRSEPKPDVRRQHLHVFRFELADPEVQNGILSAGIIGQAVPMTVKDNVVREHPDDST